ncbi:hypothetical protein CYD94_26280 (plasmid) [Ralstonia solanacearum]|uniref:Uncharacterized protein n=2 Tax=Ralstonia solanacearum species complex TaxID=3116862 RepID=A0A223GVT4_9RALS|nr:hypothetical protein CDC45_23790 [Ralstonia pseudosolanacearum]AUS45513.1 hypothetical protein CYD94_26280 [Ralstonia solanacearum]AVV67596.1 hypothetical protein RSOE_05700 [Ralstonia solanacearum OE1-1]AST89268.1 hypothetical protein CIG66_23180 [Ralstonia pseudosolanacearum]AXV72183.1 hypothetical protein CJO74_23480 [Ralstonia solanacearum]
MQIRSPGGGDRVAMGFCLAWVSRSCWPPGAKTWRIWRIQPRHTGKRPLSMGLRDDRSRHGQPTASAD